MLPVLKLLIVDDHQVLSSGLKHLLNFALRKEFKLTIHESNTGYDAIKKTSSYSYDLITMDVSMPEMSGIETTEQILRRASKSKILAISMYDDIPTVTKMIEAGAMGYVLKNIEMDELIRAVKKILHGEKYYSQLIANRLINFYSEEKNSLTLPNIPENSSILSKREIEILRMIAKEYTSKEIADKLHLSKRTIDGYRQKLLIKLEIKNTIGLIKYAMQNNLLTIF